MVSSSGSSQLQISGLEGDLQAMMAQRKQKRMLSNRESARRSRMRKQKRLDDLMFQVIYLRKENNQILTTLNLTVQHYLGVEAENSVLRTQMVELNTRLQSVMEIINYLNSEGGSLANGLASKDDDNFHWPWSPLLINQALMASDMFQYC